SRRKMSMKHRHALPLAVAIALVLVGAAAWAAEEPAPAGAAPQQAASTARFDADAATAAYMAQLSPEARARSNAYFEGGYWLILWDFLAGLVIAWLFLGTRLSQGLRDRAERLSRF